MIYKLYSSINRNLRRLYLNTTVYKKFIALLSFILCINLVTNSIALLVINHYNNKLLYEAISSALITGTDNISHQLQRVQKMTDTMIQDSRMQTNLVISTESTDNNKRKEAFLTLSFLTPEYYTNYKSNSIRYISLYTEDYATHSNIALSNKTPPDLTQTFIKDAAEKSGYPVWIDAYCNDYGLFLVRDIRKAERLELTRMGTVLVNVDVDKLVRSSLNTKMFSDSANFIITKGTQEIYHSKTLDEASLSSITLSVRENYGVITTEKQSLFYVRGKIPDFGWDFICLVPYEKVYIAQIISYLIAISINLFGILMVFMIARLFINSITTHFSTLVNKMKLFGKSHVFTPDTRYDYTIRQDEIGQLHTSFDSMALEHQALVEKFYQQEILSRDAKLKALENQINPHFLYNTLEAINWRAKSLGDKEISLMIESLGALLRTTLTHKDGNVTTIGDELNIVNNYMDIILLRFGSRLTFRIDLQEGLSQVMLPQLTLQPLVENAVNYAMEEICDSCQIDIRIFRREDAVVIQIINSGSQFDSDLLYKLEHHLIRPQGNGVGLLNIQQRIQLIYGEAYGLTFYNPDDDHAAAQITIPFEGAAP